MPIGWVALTLTLFPLVCAAEEPTIEGGGLLQRLERRPPRVDRILHSPPALRLRYLRRVRAEAVSQHPVHSADELVLSLRTLLSAELTGRPFRFLVEAIDARTYFASNEATLSNAHTNPFDLLQARVEFRGQDVFARDAQLRTRVGRFTMDLGSRRLLARNRFRNTINSFAGLDAEWTSATGQVARVFAVAPVLRRPSDSQRLRRNLSQADRVSEGTLVLGLWFKSREFFGAHGELALLGLSERDTPWQTTLSRRLLTASARLVRDAETGWVGEIEGAGQWGTSRDSRDATRDLAHRAAFVHLAIGWSADLLWRPRITVEYDFVSGDRRQGDGKQQRFDTLYGARRFDFGPTGLFGMLARSNLSAPALRLGVVPTKKLSAMIGLRAAWLASARDVYSLTGVRVGDGSAGAQLGQQLESRLRLRLVPGLFSLEAGAAYFVSGRFLRRSAAARLGNPRFAYLQTVIDL